MKAVTSHPGQKYFVSRKPTYPAKFKAHLVQQRPYGFPIKQGDIITNSGRFFRYVIGGARCGSGARDFPGNANVEDR